MGSELVTIRSPIWVSIRRCDAATRKKEIATNCRSTLLLLLASHGVCPTSGNDVQHFLYRRILLGSYAFSDSSKCALHTFRYNRICTDLKRRS